jgi:hypothetical protein
MRPDSDTLFQTLLEAWDWTPIPNCPGRFALRAATHLDIDKLLGRAAMAHEFRVQKARDAVLVVPLADGGLISYRRANGSFLHTLNTRDGFDRKLRDLGIDLGIEPGSVATE